MVNKNAFDIRLIVSDSKENPYNNNIFHIWPFSIEVLLNGVNLAENLYDRRISPRQVPGYSFDPEMFLETGMKVLDYQKANFQIGDGAHIKLNFEPTSEDKTIISLDKNWIAPDRRLLFDPSKINSAKADRELVAYKFIKVFDSVIADVKKYNDRPILEHLERYQTTLLNSPSINKMFDKNQDKLTRIPYQKPHLH